MRIFKIILITMGIAISACTESDHEGRVRDSLSILTDYEVLSLEKALEKYESETCHQIGVAVLDTTGNESIEEFSLKYARDWRLGYKGLDNGMLILLALNDKKIRIELGLGIERYISNSVTSDVIQKYAIPKLRENNVQGAIQSVVNELMVLARQYNIELKQRPEICRAT
ncbi:TPM domain-containing protein [Dasania sp. GY-MA-18]|uniref:TPM domain-containing protein n=1 Tax=Dasania phycosphaerae TaxID=2950436 RepID=A0A9J6RJY9_9GAMM|nr:MULTISPECIES: TPM domain-containing protein [Dasania]MCR8922296.1 TPM domain-containing protein [Dasania sp. GY-MA-18]MCZ0864724.1 TPM domain-containing protein [Dasania phycosphaerae]MCZ0868452.1 TPM domain-containing protein [Dasania phycosphaerae]